MQQSLVAVPDGEAFADDVRRLRDMIDDVGGQVIALRSEPFAAGDDVRLLEARNAE